MPLASGIILASTWALKAPFWSPGGVKSLETPTLSSNNGSKFSRFAWIGDLLSWSWHENLHTSRPFLPLQCQWVFGWIWGTAIPLLLGRQKLTWTQLVLSDGDCKIYNAFEEHCASTYPNARHGICKFHLVPKPITDLGYTLCNKDNPLVKDQIATFNHFNFSWMTIGGVESENKFFLLHKLLLKWLTSFKIKGQFPTQVANSHEALKHNAEEPTKILMKIMNHKECWFFPNRRHLLHLQQQSTSALEGVFSTTKCLSGKKVTPNTSLLTSVRTQDLQVQTRMTGIVASVAIQC